MKKYLTSFVVTLAFLLKSYAAMAGYCVVTSEKDDKNDVGSLRAKIEKTYNSTDANCTPPSSSSDNKFFQQSIIFQTKYLAKEGFDVDFFTLGSPSALDKKITFNNPNKNIVIGNWDPRVYNDTKLEVPNPELYKETYTNAPNAKIDYGRIVIDARHFAIGTSPFVCAPNTQDVYFRHVVLLTNNTPKVSLGSCIKNGGDFFVYSGDKELLCGDGVDNDNDGQSDCNDSDCAAAEKCKDKSPKEICDDSIDDNDQDGFNNCADTDCFGKPACPDTTPTGEICGNLVDDDRNGKADCEDDTCKLNLKYCSPKVEIEVFCNDGVDDDNDGKTDCDDSDCESDDICNPNTPHEICDDTNNTDEDDNGTANCADPYCAQFVACSHKTETGTLCQDKLDNDKDGFIDCEDDECADQANCQPEFPPESCTNDKDDDGDGLTDCDDSDCADDFNCTPENVDNDGDGYSIFAGDCDDTDVEMNPGHVEVCGDKKDNDCDKKTDEGCAGSPDEDDDGDGFCEATDKCVTTDIKPGDCDDTDAAVNPEAVEICSDNIDNDCSGGDVVAPDGNPLTGVEGPACSIESPPPGSGASGTSSSGCSCDLGKGGSANTSNGLIVLMALFATLLPLSIRLKKN